MKAEAATLRAGKVVAGERSGVAAEQTGSDVVDLGADLRGQLVGSNSGKDGEVAMAYVSITIFDRKKFSSHVTFDAIHLRPPTRNPDNPSSTR